MSHGSTDKCEPNLTPLLDLVLQLVMFFMLCANFVMEQTNATISLPEAIAAKALDKNDAYPIFLNINKEGKVLLSKTDSMGGPDTLDNEVQVENYMKRRYTEDIRATAGAKDGDPPRSVVILRADKNTPFEKVYKVMKAVRMARYERVQMRVIRYSGAE